MIASTCTGGPLRAVAVYPAERASRLVDHPEPRLEGEGQVLLQILDVGVCGTDRELARFEGAA
jgi:threonine dehydrogenase-like Zn-dependent dehydrogenase